MHGKSEWWRACVRTQQLRPELPPSSVAQTRWSRVARRGGAYSYTPRTGGRQSLAKGFSVCSVSRINIILALDSLSYFAGFGLQIILHQV